MLMSDDDLVAVDLIRLDDRVPNALCERGRVRGLLQLRHDDGELVAAEAGNRVELPDAAAQPVGDDLQQLVADRMSERVVDALEMIEVEAQHRQALAALDAPELVSSRSRNSTRLGRSVSASWRAMCAICSSARAAR